MKWHEADWAQKAFKRIDAANEIWANWTDEQFDVFWRNELKRQESEENSELKRRKLWKWDE